MLNILFQTAKTYPLDDSLQTILLLDILIPHQLLMQYNLKWIVETLMALLLYLVLYNIGNLWNINL
jgi:hypothetical protein